MANRAGVTSFPPEIISQSDIAGLNTTVAEHLNGLALLFTFFHDISATKGIMYACLLLTFLYCVERFLSYDDGLPLVNRHFALEPLIFSRFRWAFWSTDILDRAYAKPYRLTRGDADIVVLPDQFIRELNKLPQHFISSRKSHSASLTCYLNGMDVVKETNHDVKMLLSRITPALPSLLKPISQRIQSTINKEFPQNDEAWAIV